MLLNMLPEGKRTSQSLSSKGRPRKDLKKRKLTVTEDIPHENHNGTFESSPEEAVEDDVKMKPAIVADEMFPEGAGPYMDMEEAGGSSGLLLDLSANEKAVHAEFFNDFEDLYDDDDLQ